VGFAAPLLFFVGPGALIAFAVSLRTARAVESYEAVMDRAAVHVAAARDAADGEGVELPLLLAVACAESAGRADARSSAGAVGLMQLEDATAREMASAAGEPRPDRGDPATSLRLGARYLRRQLDRFEATPCPKELALAAYNAGPGNVQQWLAADPAPTPDGVFEWIRFGETRAFVERVENYESRWREREKAAAGR
jgi:soluble lytic murein transglycosylase-like protein